MGLLWAVVMAAALFFFDLGADGTYLLICLFTSMFMLVLGLVVYMGGAMLLAGYNTMSKEQQAKYNIDEITSFMGMFMTIISIIAFFMMFYFVLVAVFVGATVVVIIYLNAGKRFRADSPRRI